MPYAHDGSDWKTLVIDEYPANDQAKTTLQVQLIRDFSNIIERTEKIFGIEFNFATEITHYSLDGEEQVYT